jgi:hypothetical protein
VILNSARYSVDGVQDGFKPDSDPATSGRWSVRKLPAFQEETRNMTLFVLGAAAEGTLLSGIYSDP